MTHVSPEEIAAFRARTLDRERVEAVGAHMRECGPCARLVLGDAGVRKSAESLWKDEPRRRYGWLAAAVVLLLAIAIWIARDNPQMIPAAPPRSETAQPRVAATVIRDGSLTASITRNSAVEVTTPRPEWNAMAAAALRDGTFPSHDRAGLDAPGAVLRDGAPRRAGARLLAPLGIVVESDRPSFRWTEMSPATYRVLVARGGAVVAKSDVLAQTSWTPTEPLPRGATYEWQLIAMAGGYEFVVPAPDEPRALFRVLSQAELEELQAARATGSHLLTGLVASRLGLGAEAAAALDAFAAAHPETVIASLRRNQRPAPTTTNAPQ